MRTSAESADARFGHRDDEPAAPGHVLRLLHHDLLAESPREQQDVVGHLVVQRLGSVDRNMDNGQESALLAHIAVDDETKSEPICATLAPSRSATRSAPAECA
jgi:hypothetical protein